MGKDMGWVGTLPLGNCLGDGRCVGVWKVGSRGKKAKGLGFYPRIDLTPPTWTGTEPHITEPQIVSTIKP